jgi:hypothetical protein
MRLVIYGGLVRGWARNPLEWFHYDTLILPCQALQRPTPGLVPRSTGGGSFQGWRTSLFQLTNGPQESGALFSVCSLTGGSQRLGVISMTVAPEPSRGVSPSGGFSSFLVRTLFVSLPFEQLRWPPLREAHRPRT